MDLSQIDLSVIIVNYNTKALLKQAIDSIYNSRPELTYEVIVSDNHSKDGSVELLSEHYKDVRLIANDENLGFAKANNIAIRHSRGRYVLLLNSDTIVVDGCLGDCINYMDTYQEIGALGCKVVLPDGKLDLACRRSFPTPEVSLYRMLGLSKLFPHHQKFGSYNLTYLDENEISEVDSIVGAFMLLRREVVEQVGLLDEDYFMYGEDIDWCYRIKQAGWKVLYYPKAKIIHYKGASGGKKNPKIIYEFYRAMHLFYKKHYRDKYSFWITAAVYFGISAKLCVALVLNHLKPYKGGSV